MTCAGLDTVGVRMPSHPVVQAVIKASGVAFAAPSANLSGKPSPTNAQDTFVDMDGRLPLILDGGESAVGVESTVVAVTGEHPMILRPGYVTKEQMEAVLGEEVLVNHAILEKLKDGEVARSPGMKYKHYAPKADVTILKGSFDAYRDYIAAHAGDGVWALCFDGEEAQPPRSGHLLRQRGGRHQRSAQPVHRAAGTGPQGCQNCLCPLPAQRWRFHGRV